MNKKKLYWHKRYINHIKRLSISIASAYFYWIYQYQYTNRIYDSTCKPIWCRFFIREKKKQTRNLSKQMIENDIN